MALFPWSLSFRRLRREWLLWGLSRLSARRQRIMAWHTMASAGVHSVTFSHGGLTWRVPAGDRYIGFHLFVDGGWEKDKIAALLAWLDARGRAPGPGDVFVDIGANIGSTSIPIVATQGCRALAIEPVPATSEFLRENVTRNGLWEPFIFVDAAIVSESGTIVMETGTDIGAAAVTPTTASAPGAPGRGGQVAAVGLPLRDALARAGVTPSEVVLVWADVQGSEISVITTGADLWARGVPLWAEFEPRSLAHHGGVDAFFHAAETHFDHFIEAHDLLRFGSGAVPEPIERLAETLLKVSLHTDVLLLPPTFTA